MDYRYLGSMFRGPLTGVITIIWHWSRFGTAQPFYYVLLERDATPRYCSQENLALLRQRHRFAHPHAPFYFLDPGQFLGRAIPPDTPLGIQYRPPLGVDVEAIQTPLSTMFMLYG